MTIPCLRCGDDYEQAKRQASHFCKPCRVIRHNATKRARYHELRSTRDGMLAIVDNYVDQGIDTGYADMLRGRVDDYLDDQRTRKVPTGHDQMPPGTNSPSGSEDGTSTYFTDLAEELDAHSREVAKHPWFAANPHWSYNLSSLEDAE